VNTILPIGSVVKLKKGTKPVMIFGYMQKSSLYPDQMMDYIGVPYPEGNLHVKAQLGFQTTDIGEVLFEGFRDESFEPWEALLKISAERHKNEA
jgi:hypothetical protein